MDRQSYRNITNLSPTIYQAPVDEWRELAKRIEIELLHSKRLNGRKVSADEVIDKITSDWTRDERHQFRYWYRNTRKDGTHTTASTKMERTAFNYSPYGNDAALEEFDKKRTSIIGRLRRLQNDIGKMFSGSKKMIDWNIGGKYGSGEEKLEAIQSALNQICTLMITLRTKELTTAALKRTAKVITAIDQEAGSMFKQAVSEGDGFVRTAQAAPIAEIGKLLKHELDQFHYGTHLRRMFAIYDKLMDEGYSSLAGQVEDIISKELSSLTGLSKKVSEVYTELLKIPNREAANDKPEVKPESTAPQAERFETLDDSPQENVPAREV